MKLASFFLISVALHVAVLALPLSFFKADSGQIIPVILYGGTDSNGEEHTGESGNEGGREKIKVSTNKPQHARKEGPQTQGLNGTSPLQVTSQTGNHVSLLGETLSEVGIITGRLSKANSGETLGISLEETRSWDSPGESVGKEGSEIGIGSRAQGRDTSGSGAVFFEQANYAYNPRPEYPEAARREGWEGTVLLRVLVDQEGQSKGIEISRSSGFETLDRAALDTVKRWRFYPARYGERRVESWVRIPIEFRLADLKD